LDEQVFPLIPDGRRARAVHRARERDRHLGVGADREALADHHPRTEPALSEKVLSAAAYARAGDQTDAGNDHEIADEDSPIETGNQHVVTVRTRSSHASASQSAVTDPHVETPRYDAGIVDAIGTTDCSGRPVKRTVFARARSSVRLEPAR